MPGMPHFFSTDSSESKAGSVLRGKVLIPQGITVDQFSEIIQQPPDILGNIALELYNNKNILLGRSQIEMLCAICETHYEIIGLPKKRRPPVISIMGHVDHGKTTLLDALRQSEVTQTEYGEITQSIGAFSLTTKGGRAITVIDTPGHEVFSKMRSRGAESTDIVVMVVSAIEGVEQQTIEVIDLARKAGAAIIVAINKVDRKEADCEKVLMELEEHGIDCEEVGGEIPSVQISAKYGTNVDRLAEQIEKLANKIDLDEVYDCPAQGIVIETEMKKKQRFGGITGSVLVMRGNLQVGQSFVCGRVSGKVKIIKDDYGSSVRKLEAGKAGHLSGFKETPTSTGMILHGVKSENDAGIVLFHKNRHFGKVNIRRRLFNPKATSNIIYGREIDEERAFPVILKASKTGIMETILDELKTHLFKGNINLIHTGIGAINEQDIISAASMGAVIFGFDVDCPSKVVDMALSEKVPIRMHRLIYELTQNFQNLEDEVDRRQGGKYDKQIIGQGKIKRKFTLRDRRVVAAGVLVSKGRFTKTARFRIIRKGYILKDNLSPSSIKIHKNDVDEVTEGFECGISFDNFDDFAENDTIESFQRVEKQEHFRFTPGLLVCD